MTGVWVEDGVDEMHLQMCNPWHGSTVLFTLIAASQTSRQSKDCHVVCVRVCVAEPYHACHVLKGKEKQARMSFNETPTHEWRLNFPRYTRAESPEMVARQVPRITIRIPIDIWEGREP
jgi:hypothetical protein